MIFNKIILAFSILVLSAYCSSSPKDPDAHPKALDANSSYWYKEGKIENLEAQARYGHFVVEAKTNIKIKVLTKSFSRRSNGVSGCGESDAITSANGLIGVYTKQLQSTYGDAKVIKVDWLKGSWSAEGDSRIPTGRYCHTNAHPKLYGVVVRPQ